MAFTQPLLAGQGLGLCTCTKLEALCATVSPASWAKRQRLLPFACCFQHPATGKQSTRPSGFVCGDCRPWIGAGWSCTGVCLVDSAACCVQQDPHCHPGLVGHIAGSSAPCHGLGLPRPQSTHHHHPQGDITRADGSLAPFFFPTRHVGRS